MVAQIGGQCCSTYAVSPRQLQDMLFGIVRSNQLAAKAGEGCAALSVQLLQYDGLLETLLDIAHAKRCAVDLFVSGCSAAICGSIVIFPANRSRYHT